MRRHVLWTRLVAARRTTSPHGDHIDLLEYARTERESLVLKPNRSYGGDGVMVGHSVEQGEWERALDRALAEPETRWVLQQAAPIPVKSFHVLDDATGEVHVEPFYVVMGFASNRYGVALLARASQQQVVNVAQHGGVCAVMVGAQAMHTREFRIRGRDTCDATHAVRAPRGDRATFGSTTTCFTRSRFHVYVMCTSPSAV